MRIGTVDIEPRLILAPMEGVTDITFRRLIRQIGGCGLTVTEFVPARGLREDIPRVLEMVEFDDDERPLAIQVYGRESATMAEGARIAQELGADIVDLNMGCPSRAVTRRSGGSALMLHTDLARSIVAAMRAALDVPFTVKMRAGWDQQHRNAPEIASMCEQEGVDAVAVHWRTKEDRYGGERDLRIIAAVKQAVDIPVIANGDVVDAESALDTLEKTGCDGLMIGRGAIRNPWVFREIQAALGGETYPEVGPTEREQVLLGYYEAIRTRFRSDLGALGRMKKIARYFTGGVPHATILRDAIWHSDTVDEAEFRVRLFFERLRRWEAGDETAFDDDIEAIAAK